MMDNIKVIICDLDGTLYQDEKYCKRFISHILKGSEFEADEEAIQQKAEAILSGKDTFLLGSLYDRTIDLSGKSLEERLDIQPIINSDVHFENYLDRRYTCISDGWNLVFLLANRLGISEKVAHAGFAKVREEMLTSEYAIEVNKELVEILGELSKHMEAIYLLTNTGEPEAIDFIKYIGLEDKFKLIKYAAMKPFGLMDFLPEILKTHGIKGEEILAIGDHGYNDLYPVKRLGGKTILTTPYELHSHVEWSARVHTLEELKEELKKVLELNRR